MKRSVLLIFSLIHTIVFAATPSRNFLTNFYDEFLLEQKQYLAAGQLTSPAPTGYVPFTIVNNSTFADTDIYILILTNSLTQIITFNNVSGQMLGANTSPPPSTYVSQAGSGSYNLNYFLNTATGTYTFYLPSTVNMNASRIYYSVGQPIDWFINSGGAVIVPPQDFADPSQDGYYTLFDKQEFTMDANDRFVMNPTLVDYYGLPVSFSISYLDYSQSTPVQTTAYAGLPPTLSSSTIFANYAAAVAPLPTTPAGGTKPYWSGLNLSYTPPSGSSGPLRVLSPSSGIQTNSPLLVNPLFPINYFLTNTYTNCDWLTTVWTNGATLYVDLSTAGPGYGVAEGIVDMSGNFNFTALTGTGTGSTLVLPLPTSSRAFFTSTLSDYLPAPTITGDPNVATAIWQGFSAAVISGIYPLSTTQSTPLSQSYIRQQTLFTNNPGLCTGPWYDFYSGTFIGMGSSPYLKFYTTPYGDYLGTDGTITVTNIANAGAAVTVTLGNMSSIPVPNPFNDNNMYTVTFTPPSANATVTFGPNPDFTSNPAPTPNVPIPNVVGSTMYLGVTYISGPYAGKIWGVQIIPSAPTVKPALPIPSTMSLSGGPGSTLTITVGG